MGTRIPALWQGVSFFFVLSGFILAWVYPSLDKSRARERFLLARFARIWPTHFVAFLVTLLLVPSSIHVPNAFLTAFANLSMVQAWSFNPVIENSFNAVSWTISIEFFFYICFPFLIKDFEAETKPRWIFAVLTSLACVGLALVPYVAKIPGCTFLSPVLINTNPLCRLLEFTIGIATCRLFKINGLPQSINRTKATILEVCTLISIAIAVSLPIIWTSDAAPGFWSVLRIWAINLGGAPFYAALIFLMACPRGCIAELLTKKLFVNLGEISFSLYMFHLGIIYALLPFREPFGNLPDWVLPSMAFVGSILIAHLNYSLIETPFRFRILNMVRAKKPVPPHATHEPIRVLLIFSEVLLLFLAVLWLNTQFRFISKAVSDRIVAHSVPNTRGIKFGDNFVLLGLKLSKKHDGLHMDAVWKSMVSRKLDLINTIQISDARGKVLVTKLCPQDSFHRSVAAGQVWEDKLVLKPDELKNALTLGIQLYDPSTGKPLSTNNDSINGCILLALP